MIFSELFLCTVLTVCENVDCKKARRKENFEMYHSKKEFILNNINDKQWNKEASNSTINVYAW